MAQKEKSSAGKVFGELLKCIDYHLAKLPPSSQGPMRDRTG